MCIHFSIFSPKITPLGTIDVKVAVLKHEHVIYMIDTL